MAGSVNKVILVGNLGKDPEVRNAQDGNRIVNFTLATNESWNDRVSGERKERVEWHRIVIFNDKLGEIAEKYCRKGSKVYVEGQLRTRKWTDNTGADKYTTEVVIERFRGDMTLLDSRSSGEGGMGGGGMGGGGYEGGGMGSARPPAAIPAARAAGGPSWDTPPKGGSDLDDEIPF